MPRTDQCAEGMGRPRIPNGHRVRHVYTRHTHDSVLDHLGQRRIEVSVLTGNRKAQDLGTPTVAWMDGRVELDHDRVILPRHGLVERRFVGQGLAILGGQCPPCQTLAKRRLERGMHLNVTQIVGHHKPGIRMGKMCLQLRLTDKRRRPCHEFFGLVDLRRESPTHHLADAERQ